MSLILYPDYLKPMDLFLFQINVSLTVLNVVRQYLPEEKVFLKWPNDIYVENLKIGGLLLQSGIRGQEIEYLVVGIGLNVNQTNFPDNLNFACSLASLINAGQDLELVTRNLKEAIEADCHSFRDNFSNKEWRTELLHNYEKQLYQIDAWKTYYTPDGKSFEGKILGVFEDGPLKIMLTNGLIQKFNFKEILYRKT